MTDTGRTILIVVLVIIALPLLWGGMIMGGGMDPGLMGGGGGWDRWDPGRAALSMLSTVLVIGGIGAVIWWTFRSPSASPPSGRSGVRDIRDARYARGEITREQYQQMQGDFDS